MNDRSIGTAKVEQTDETTTRVRVEYANGKTNVFYLEPGNGFQIEEDGPIAIEVFAVDN